MESDTLNYHMMISLNASEVDEIENLDFTEAIKLWKDRKSKKFTVKKH